MSPEPGASVIAEANTSGTLLRRYVPGPGVDEPVVWYEGAGTADRRWLQADERGSVVSVSDAALALGRYDEYGIPQPGNMGRFQYTGQTWFAELGLYNYKARMYSPTLGRFMQTDPIGYGDGLNWHNYAHGDPVNGTDPSGTIMYSDGFVECDCSISPPYNAIPSNHSYDGLGGAFAAAGMLYNVSGRIDEARLDRALSAPTQSVSRAPRQGIVIVGDLGLFDGGVSDGDPNSIAINPNAGPTLIGGGGRIQIGLGGADQFGFLGYTGGIGIAIDTRGNIALYGTNGYGTGFGLFGGLGPSIQVSNAKTVYDLASPFYNTSASFGDGIAGSVDYFTGNSPNGKVTGIGLTGEGGGGASFFGGKTDTTIRPIINFGQ